MCSAHNFRASWIRQLHARAVAVGAWPDNDELLADGAIIGRFSSGRATHCDVARDTSAADADVVQVAVVPEREHAAGGPPAIERGIQEGKARPLLVHEIT